MMQNKYYDVVVLGGGPAGLAAALSARKSGAESVLIVERDREAGGILNQCIHNGFGLHYFKEELTGPEYAGRFVDMLEGTDIDLRLNTMALELTPARQVHIIGREEGYQVLDAGAVVLAMGCRERTRGAIALPGERPSGIFTAGTAQRYVNMEGYMVGKRVLILGSGDIGLIMARRMTLEGAKVLACVELMPYSGGLTRNIVQCLQDYDIPLLLSHTITDIRGEKRVEGATVMRMGENRKPIPGTETEYECDTILLSVGLIPENELTRGAGIAMDPRTGGAVVYENMETSLAGVFACGNVAHVHDLVDFVTAEALRAGEAAARYVATRREEEGRSAALLHGHGISYTVPQRIRAGVGEDGLDVYFRVNQVFGRSEVLLKSGGRELARFKKERLAPGEMEKIRIRPAVYAQAEGQELTVEVEG